MLAPKLYARQYQPFFIKRGRWYNQLDQNELVEQIQTLIKPKETQWDFRPGFDQKDRNSKPGGTTAISSIYVITS